jgi:hypothetical protein
VEQLKGEQVVLVKEESGRVMGVDQIGEERQSDGREGEKELKPLKEGNRNKD